jgi:hypothetical protein
MMVGVGVVLTIAVLTVLFRWRLNREEFIVGTVIAPKGASGNDYFYHCRHNSIHLSKDGESGDVIGGMKKILHVINLRRVVFATGNWFLEHDWMRLEMFRGLPEDYKVVFIDLPNAEKTVDKYGREVALKGGGESVFCNNSIIINFGLDEKVESDAHVTAYLEKAKKLGVNVLGLFHLFRAPAKTMADLPS